MRGPEIDEQDVPRLKRRVPPGVLRQGIERNAGVGAVGQAGVSVDLLGKPLGENYATRISIDFREWHPANAKWYAGAVRTVLMDVMNARRVLGHIGRGCAIFGDWHPERLVVEQRPEKGVYGVRFRKNTPHLAIGQCLHEKPELIDFGAAAFEFYAVILDAFFGRLPFDRLDETAFFQFLDELGAQISDHALIENIAEKPVAVTVPGIIQRSPITLQVIVGLQFVQHRKMRSGLVHLGTAISLSYMIY